MSLNANIRAIFGRKIGHREKYIGNIRGYKFLSNARGEGEGNGTYVRGIRRGKGGFLIMRHFTDVRDRSTNSPNS